MKRFNIKSRKGFTLIELLVVIGILAVLAAIAIPSVAGLIDRANVSADNTNANEMTNAIERFASEYELYVQDIGSGALDPNDLDSAQGRVYNVTGATTRGDITAIEKAQSVKVADVGDEVAIYRDTKYPVNNVTLQKIVENYMKTSSSTFEPKQSDCNYYYSPDCGLVVCTETDKSETADLNALVQSGKDAKGKTLGPETQWINITNNAYEQVTKELSTFTSIVWNGLDNFDGNYVWSDGTNCYYSSNNKQYVLKGDTWEPKTWKKKTNAIIHGKYIWTDGTRLYHSLNNYHCVLNGDTWEAITWNGLTSFNGDYIWSDGTNCYYSSNEKQYVLKGDTWEPKTWDGLTNFYGYDIWTDGVNTYHSNGDKQYILNGDIWEPQTWTGVPNHYLKGEYMFNYNNRNYVIYCGIFCMLQEDGTWKKIETDNGPDYGSYVWTDNTNCCYSRGANHYIFS